VGGREFSPEIRERKTELGNWKDFGATAKPIYVGVQGGLLSFIRTRAGWQNSRRSLYHFDKNYYLIWTGKRVIRTTSLEDKGENLNLAWGPT